MDATSFSVASIWANALDKDAALNTFAKDKFGKDFTVHVGFDVRQLLDESDAPFIVLDPEGHAEDAGHMSRAHTINIACAIVDEEWEQVDGGAKIMRGLKRLDSIILPRIISVVDNAMSGATRGKTTVSYDLSFFPLIYIDATITVDIARPIGRRRP
ncbi:MAG: hypothetical protein R3Y11_00475 [Pseudomonadota bacterium]